MIGRNDPCWCGSRKKWKKCHYPKTGRPTPVSITRLQKETLRKQGILIKTEEQIAGIRRASHLAAHILEEVCRHAKEGVTTGSLNDLGERLCKEAGAKPASLGYGTPPFPKSLCISLNEVICHGIPGEETLKAGDIANIDFACILDGYYGDCSRMVTIGEIDAEKQLVVDTSYDCLMEAIAILKPGVPVCKIGDVISDRAEAAGCSVVHQFVAHGVGIHYHEGPQILHSRNKNQTPITAGMTFTIEPMINAGQPDAIIDPEDQWTARTSDGKPSAQWEHTLLITPTGSEILTPWVR